MTDAAADEKKDASAKKSSSNELRSSSSTPQVTVADLADKPVVLFDGVCNFCNGAIQFMVDHEREPTLSFAPIQSDLAKELLDKTFGEEKSLELRSGLSGNGDPDTIVLVEGSKGYTHSTAGLRIARYFRAPWSWGYVSIILPRFLRDFVYRFIAKNRYRWFGRSETCRIPTPELRKRFLA